MSIQYSILIDPNILMNMKLCNLCVIARCIDSLLGLMYIIIRLYMYILLYAANVPSRQSAADLFYSTFDPSCFLGLCRTTRRDTERGTIDTTHEAAPLSRSTPVSQSTPRGYLLSRRKYNYLIRRRATSGSLGNR